MDPPRFSSYFLLFLVSLSTTRCVREPDPTSLDYRRQVQEWFSEVNRDLSALAHQHAILFWQTSINMTLSSRQALAQFESYRSTWSSSVCNQVQRLRIDLLDATSRRMAYRMCRGVQLNQEQAEEWNDAVGQLRQVFSDAVVTVNGRNYSGEDELNRIMADWRNQSVLLQAWIGWRNAVGPPSRPLYQKVVEIANAGSRAAGYHDLGQVWREELEMDHLESVVDRIYAEIEPFYRQLHAFVRGRLSEIYGPSSVDPDQPIPAHLLGNMWAQNWESLLPHLISTSHQANNITRILLERNVTVKGMAAMAQDFYISLGFPPLPSSFWTKSQFTKPPSGRSTVCHASSIDLFQDGDVRLLMCAKVNEEDFMTMHHEMGHLYYYLTYARQPYLFRTGANSAFHEAVGETIVYGAMSAKHRKRMGFLEDRGRDLQELEIEDLLRHALVKIPLFPFSLVVEKWRWNVFAGRIKPHNYNKMWWLLRTKYQGISPPVKRTEADFDPAAKYHIIDGVPYIRYFLSGILQVQFFQALCEASGQGPKYGQLLNQCDIYGSIPAGQRLRKMMSLGASKPWNEALKALTNGETSDINVGPLLDYYEPLYRWLIKENKQRNYTVGWPGS